MGHCYNKIEINASIDAVWNTINDFHDMSWAEGVIDSVIKEGDKTGHEVGAKRILNDAIHETLTSVNPSNYNFTYRIDDGPGPISKTAVDNYIGEVQLSKTANGTLVEWSSNYQADKESEVAEFCNPIYSALLAALNENVPKY
ncbi:MAG: SRPBCC family protein [Pseudomonadales bacterium]|nr:SRPBCC family protein [Pseudomonadales bacterium]